MRRPYRFMKRRTPAAIANKASKSPLWAKLILRDPHPRGLAIGHFKCTGWVNAPFPAESQAENRTHFFPEASNGMRKC